MTEPTDLYGPSTAIEFYADTDVKVPMGAGKHAEEIPVRFLNDADFEALGQQLYVAFKALRQRKSAPGTLSKLAIKHQIYAFVATALSNPDEQRVISIGYLRSCPPGQIPRALRAIVEGNKTELLEAWEMLPESFRKPLGDLGGGAMKSIFAVFKSGTNLNQMVDEVSNVLRDAAEQAAEVAGPLIEQVQAQTQSQTVDAADAAETYLDDEDVFPSENDSLLLPNRMPDAGHAPAAYVEAFQEYAHDEPLPDDEAYSASAEAPEPALLP